MGSRGCRGTLDIVTVGREIRTTATLTLAADSPRKSQGQPAAMRKKPDVSPTPQVQLQLHLDCEKAAWRECARLQERVAALESEISDLRGKIDSFGNAMRFYGEASVHAGMQIIRLADDASPLPRDHVP